MIIRSDTLLMDEDEDPKEGKFEEKEDPQEEEDDMEVNIEEDENGTRCDGLLSGLMRRDINSLFGRMASLQDDCVAPTAHALGREL
ncbi:hypothetical protein Tco_1048483 [Tanacetum coccineum]